jgi:hypothetical protein
MGGQSTSTQTQQSQTTPWAATQPMLQTMLGQIGTGLNNTGLTSAESTALDTLRNNAAQGNPYAGQISGYAQSLLSGGGATAQAGNVQDNIAAYRNWLTPYANGSMIGKAIATILTSFGIEEEDRRELRADFEHLRRWRRSVEQAQSYTFKAVITVIATGLVGAVWLGIKVMLGK